MNHAMKTIIVPKTKYMHVHLQQPCWEKQVEMVKLAFHFKIHISLQSVMFSQSAPRRWRSRSINRPACNILGVRIPVATDPIIKTGSDSSTAKRSATGVSVRPSILIPRWNLLIFWLDRAAIKMPNVHTDYLFRLILSATGNEKQVFWKHFIKPIYLSFDITFYRLSTWLIYSSVSFLEANIKVVFYY